MCHTYNNIECLYCGELITENCPTKLYEGDRLHEACANNAKQDDLDNEASDEASRHQSSSSQNYGYGSY